MDAAAPRWERLSRRLHVREIAGYLEGEIAHLRPRDKCHDTPEQGVWESTRMPSVGVFAAIYDDGGRILLVRSASGRKAWSLPGGGMERGESPDEALRREVEEEAGYVVRTGRMIGIYSTPFKDNLVMTFEAHATRQTKWAPNSEISEFGWFAPTALPEPIRPRALIRIEDALAHRHGVIRVFKRDDG